MRRALITAARVMLIVAAAIVLPAYAASVVDVSSGNFYFEDSTPGDGQIVIDAGDQLRVTVVEGNQHTVDIAAFGIASAKLAAGDVFVTPPLNTPGTYQLVCDTHLNRGHQTNLVILGDITTTTATTTVTTTTTTATTVSTTTTVPTPTGVTARTSTTTAIVGETTTSTSETTMVGTGEVESRVSDDEPPGDPTDSSTTLASGIVSRQGLPLWTRSIWVGLLALIPLTALAFVALRRSDV